MRFRGHIALPVTPVAVGLVLGMAGTGRGEGQEPAAKGPAPVAVVELFTSQTCPSCPAADTFLDELRDQAERAGQKLFALAFHVDYWSPPGRKDPLSSDQFAQRQRSYVQAMRLEGAYTPQMIVNGRKEFVGSQRRQGQQAIRDALARSAEIELTLEAHKPGPGRHAPYEINVQASTVPRDAVINVALVEREVAARPVGAARSRTCENVVRVFRTIPLRASGRHTLQLSVPPGAVADTCEVVAYVQSTRDGAVLGAASTDLHPAPVAQARMQPRE